MKTRFTGVYLVVVMAVFCLAFNVQAADDYESRLKSVIDKQISGEVQDRQQDVYGKTAALRIVKGVDLDEANEIVLSVAEWFEHPHPRGRKLDGEPDFAAYNLCRLYHLAKDSENLYPETKKAIERFFTDYDSKSIFPSENHYLLFRSSRYLMAATLKNPPENGKSAEEVSKIYVDEDIYHRWFEAYRDEAAAIEIEDKHWLRGFLKYRTKHGWGEFDSSYIHAQFECLINLYDFAPDEQIRDLAKLNLDMLTIGMAFNSVEGIYGGARGRGGPKSGFDHKTPASYMINHLYFGNCPAVGKLPMILFYGTDYRPHPLIVRFARSRKEPYVHRERKHLHNVIDARPYEPLEGSIRKYTYVTPKYIMGCVQFQDDYPEGHVGAWYRNHQQHQWDLSFVGDTLLRVFTGHPIGKDDGLPGRYWIGSGGEFFQHRNALVAVYDIDPEMTYQFIHAYFPKERFDEVVEKGSWVFARYGSSAVGLRFSSPYRWVEEGRYAGEEIISEGGKHAVACEVRSLESITFEEFTKELLANKAVFNKDTMAFSYHSQAEGLLEIDTSGKRRHNGRDEDLDYPSFASPYTFSKWGSGVLDMTFDGEKVIFDAK